MKMTQLNLILRTLSFVLALFCLRPEPARAQAVELKPISSSELKTLIQKPGKKPGAHKGTVVNVWATWCEPCKAEMPDLIKFRKEYLK
jgi:thiol-disulfide isomerase/thioredoxin